jgi:membrane protease YdiL (CAAX protease family)
MDDPLGPGPGAPPATGPQWHPPYQYGPPPYPPYPPYPPPPVSPGRPPVPRGPLWPVFTLLGLLALAVVVGSMAALAVQSALGRSVTDKTAPGATLAGLFAQWAVFVGATWWWARRQREQPPSVALGIGPLRGKDVLLGLAWAGAMLVAAQAVATVAAVLLHPKLRDTFTDYVVDTKGVAGVLLVGLGVLGAPVIEEFFFRGALLGALRRRARTGVAVATSAFIFAILHADAFDRLALVTVTSIFAVGVMLAAFRVMTGRLWPCVVAHMSYNAIIFTLASLITRHR